MVLHMNPSEAPRDELKMATPPEYVEDRTEKNHYKEGMEFASKTKNILEEHPNVKSEIQDMHEFLRTAEIDDGTDVSSGGRGEAHAEALNAAKKGAYETLIAINIDGKDESEISQMMDEIDKLEKGTTFKDTWGDGNPKKYEISSHTTDTPDKEGYRAFIGYSFGEVPTEVSEQE